MWPFRRRTTTTDAPDTAETFARPPMPAPTPVLADDDVAEDLHPAVPAASAPAVTAPLPVPARHPAMPLAMVLLDRPSAIQRQLPPTDLDAAVHDIIDDLVGPGGRYRLVPRTPGEDDGDEIFTRLIVQSTVERIGHSIDDALALPEVEAPTAPVIAIAQHRARRG